MVKSFLNLSSEEKDFIARISAISCIDENIIKDVLQSILKMITIEQYAGLNNIYIPYVCNIIINSFEKITDKGVKTVVELEAIPSKHLINEIKAVNEGEITPTQDFTRQRIYGKLESIIQE